MKSPTSRSAAHTLWPGLTRTGLDEPALLGVIAACRLLVLMVRWEGMPLPWVTSGSGGLFRLGEMAPRLGPPAVSCPALLVAHEGACSAAEPPDPCPRSSPGCWEDGVGICRCWDPEGVRSASSEGGSDPEP